MGADFSQIHRFIRGLATQAERLETDLKALAHRRARVVQAAAQARVRVATGATKNRIVVVDDSRQKQFRVEVEDVPGRNPMVPVWIEFGTGKMAARPFLNPAVDQSRAAYVAEAETLLSKRLQEIP